MSDDSWKQQLRGPAPLGLAIAGTVWVILLLLVLFGEDARQLAASSTSMQVPAAPVTRPFDTRLATGSADLPLDDPRLQRTAATYEPEQISLALAGHQSMFVSWSSGNASFRIAPDAAANEAVETVGAAASQVQYGLAKGQYTHTTTGSYTAYTQSYSNATYTSGHLHHVKLDHLLPSTTYFYRCGDPDRAWSAELNFTTPQAVSPDAFPQTLGIIGDLGGTYNSSSTLQHLMANKPPVVVLTGDFSYADDYAEDGSHGPRFTPTTYPPRWDAWGRLMQPLTSSVPFMGLVGNHEIETDAKHRDFQAYTNRFRFPFAESGSPSQLFYSFDLAGVHFVMLATYASFEKGSEQVRWLKQDLAAFDRQRTPWLIAGMHAPWYNTYIAHYKEAECFRVAIENMLYDAGVDMVFSGHVHAYERSNRVYDYKLDACAPMHITIGDGGNVERLYTQWVDNPPSNCPAPLPGSCVTKQQGRFCPVKQPDWSAFREPSFGHGMLTFHNASDASFTWHRNQDGAAVVSDTVHIQRNLDCHNQQ